MHILINFIQRFVSCHFNFSVEFNGSHIQFASSHMGVVDVVNLIDSVVVIVVCTAPASSSSTPARNNVHNNIISNIAMITRLNLPIFEHENLQIVVVSIIESFYFIFFNEK